MSSTLQREQFWSGQVLLERIRDGPNTTTTINLKNNFGFDAAPKRHVMAHQMKNLCGFSVFHCAEGAFGASSGGTPKMKNGAREMNSRMVVVVVGLSLREYLFETWVWGWGSFVNRSKTTSTP